MSEEGKELKLFEGLSEEEKRDLIQYVAEQVELLLRFSGSLLIYRPVIEEATKEAEAIRSRSGAASVVYEAMGVDWQRAELESNVQAQRGRALLGFLDSLFDTEKGRLEFNNSEVDREIIAKQMREGLGL